MRRWPRETPSTDGIQYIHAVLGRAQKDGFTLCPYPLRTRDGSTFVIHDGRFWELSPWMPGTADYHRNPSAARLCDAMTALARFHQAVAGFPHTAARGIPAYGPSPAIRERCDRLQKLLSGGIDELAGSVRPGVWPELLPRAESIVSAFRRLAPATRALLNRAGAESVPLQPCIRDVWHDHVLFEGDRVSGLIDFGSMATDSVAGDVARLLGSLVGDDHEGWRTGLDAYQAVRPLSEPERLLVRAFDRSTVLLSGLNWIDWLYRQRRVFENRAGVLSRVDEIVARLLHRVEHAGEV